VEMNSQLHVAAVLNSVNTLPGVGIAQSLKGLAAGWTVCGSNPGWGGGARFSAPVQTDLGVHAAFYTMGTWSFPGYSGRVVALNTHPYLEPRLKKRVELYFYSP